MTHIDPTSRLNDEIQILFRLNPETAQLAAGKLYGIADNVPAEQFTTFSKKAADLIQAYINSPWKHAETLILAEYFDYFERSTKLLQERGELTADAPPTTSEQNSVALVSPRLYTSLDWCRVSSAANVPVPLQRSIDACVRRNRLLSSVLEIMFNILHCIDHQQALDWELNYLDDNRGSIDPDIVRDLTRVWQHQTDLPQAALNWALSWSVDENLAHQWPSTVTEADALLRQHALRKWLTAIETQSARLTHLRMLISTRGDDSTRLRRWLDNTMTGMSESVDFFVKLGQDTSRSQCDDSGNWVQAALIQELHSIESTFVPILILADLILARPSGANQFALAIFGLSENGRCAWSRKILSQSRKIVLRLFLNGLRQKVSPEETIRSLCFRDPQLFLQTVGELDLATRQFDSLKQRDKVVDRLTSYYASFREDKLINLEISQRYRQLMRVVHEDSLRRLFPPELMESLSSMTTLFSDLASLSSDARRFLNQRRSQDATLEEITAAELDFIKTIRQRRKSLIHRVLAK